MNVRIRFHLDENVDPAIADGLRRRGVDVTTELEAGLLGAEDGLHLDHGLKEQRVIVTHDDDFLSLAKKGSNHCGIAWRGMQTRSIGQILAALMLIHDCLSVEDMRNHIEFL